MVRRAKIWFGVLGCAGLLGSGCASNRDELRMPSRVETAPAKPSRSIFSWRREAKANEPTTLSIVKTKPEKSSLDKSDPTSGSSLSGPMPSAGSRFSPLTVKTTKPATSTPYETKPKLAVRGAVDAVPDSTKDADLPVLTKPLGLPVAKSRSMPRTGTGDSITQPKPLELGDGGAAKTPTNASLASSTEPTRFPKMPAASTGQKSTPDDPVIYELPARHALRPAFAKVAESAPAASTTETKPTSTAIDDADLPSLSRSLAPPMPSAAKAQNNQLPGPVPIPIAGKTDNAVAKASSSIPLKPPADLPINRTIAEKVTDATTARKAPSVPSAADLLAPVNAKLEVDRLAFCTQVLGFGEIEKMPAEHLTPGRPVLIYGEVRNFASASKDGVFETTLISQISLETRQGATAARFDFDPIVDRCQTKRTDFYCHYTFSLPKSLPPGAYVLRLKVKDTTSGKQAETTLNFEVVASSETASTNSAR